MVFSAQVQIIPGAVRQKFRTFREKFFEARYYIILIARVMCNLSGLFQGGNTSYLKSKANFPHRQFIILIVVAQAALCLYQCGVIAMVHDKAVSDRASMFGLY
jgi:hypothetical protein